MDQGTLHGGWWKSATIRSETDTNGSEGVVCTRYGSVVKIVVLSASSTSRPCVPKADR